MQNTNPNIRIRVFQYPEDLHGVRRLYISGRMDGPGALYPEMAARVSPCLLTASVTFVAGLVGVYASSSSLLTAPARRLALSVGGQLSLLSWISSALACLSAIAWLHAWFQLRKFKAVTKFRIEQAFNRDFTGAGKFLLTPAVLLENSMNELKACGSTNGFWVAEDEKSGEVIGCIGLDCTSKDDPTIGEMCRLAVVPSYRRRGIGKMLIDVVINHARAKSLKSLWLSTSEFHAKIYQGRGWTLYATRKGNLGGMPLNAVYFRKELV